MTTNRQSITDTSPDGFNEELTPDALKTIGELITWQTTTPPSPFGTAEADVTDDPPYTPPVFVADGTEFMTNGEVNVLYGARPAPIPVGTAPGPSTGTSTSAKKA